MVKMTREKALTEREFEQLLLGATQLKDERRQLEARAAILIGGRLGLRPGELTHLDESWVSRRREMIHIPSYDPCTDGRDGGRCGYCQSRAEQNSDGTDQSVDDLLEEYWNPKTDAAVRDVPYGFSQRTAVAVEWLIDEHGGWPRSFSTIGRRLDNALQAAPRLATDSTSPHGLRGTAASYHAGRGLDAGPMQAMFGWSDLATARNYIAIDGEMTRRALGEVHG